MNGILLTAALTGRDINSLPPPDHTGPFSTGPVFLYAERRVLMMYIALPAFCGMVPTFTPYAGPCWEYKCMIVRRKEYPTDYRLCIKRKGNASGSANTLPDFYMRRA